MPAVAALVAHSLADNFLSCDLSLQEQAGMFDKQLGTPERQPTREEELGMFTLEDSAFLPMQPSDAEASGADEKPVWRTQDKL